ncbi:unnamed protein product [Linum trigynum]|uniref:Uncharacterized protein n=1 Tax=Linum trigynum TaxID=586398 RepID=A0AAV2CY38_9ROSI
MNPKVEENNCGQCTRRHWDDQYAERKIDANENLELAANDVGFEVTESALHTGIALAGDVAMEESGRRAG